LPRAVAGPLLAAGLLAAAMPGMAPSPCGLLVLPGLAVQCALLRRERPLWTAYWLGAVFVLAFSCSLRHVLLPGWLAIGAVGGLYFALAAWLSARLSPLFGPLAFGLALAASNWLRANMPEIPYPHGQPCHALYLWPALLGSVRWGGEALANLLLGTLVAAAVDVGRGWRLGVPPFRRASRTFALALLAAAVADVIPPPAAPLQPAVTVDVLAVEPGLHPLDAVADVGSAQAFEQRYREIIASRLVQPTLTVAGAEAKSPPDLVLWPESSLWRRALATSPVFAELHDLELHEETRLCFGGSLLGSLRRDLPVAVLVDARGNYIGHHEKQCLVPAGEFLPFVHLLPDALTAPLLDFIASAMGQPPNAVAGSVRPPLQTASGVKFGALLCYDNAFPGPAAAQVAQGARFLCVLSNEAWYRGGAELEQLLAQTVVRALETATPLVRCTTDGRTALVDSDGAVVAALAPAPAPQPAARTCRFSVHGGPGQLPSMAWLQTAMPWVVLFACLLAFRPRRLPLG
jgi:apolipoprotein N-acyltransferase